MMSDSIVDLANDSRAETLSSSIMGIPLNCHLHPLCHNHLEPKIISLSDDSDLERVSRNSLGEGTSSSNSLENLLSKIGIKVNCEEDPFPPHLLFEREI